MIDIHAHPLPEVDDGAKSMDEAVQMCRLAAEDGCEAIIVTPHQRHEHWANLDRARLEERRALLQEAVGPSPRLVLGAEIWIDSDLLGALERFPQCGLISLANSRYLLLEGELGRYGPDPLELAHELRLAGWIPIFAHPERSRWLVDRLDLVQKLAAQGALFQITAMSVLGLFGQKARDFTRKLLDASLAHFLASDMHGAARRPPGLKKAYDEIAARWGEAVARRLSIDNPRAVLEHGSVRR